MIGEDLGTRKDQWGEEDDLLTWPRRLPEGHLWFVGSGVVTRGYGGATYAQVIIPVEDIAEMTAEQIGHYVKRLAPDAEALRALQFARDLLDHRKQIFKDHRAHLNYATDIAAYIRRFVSHPELDPQGLIPKALQLVADLHKHVDAKETGKQTKKFERAVARRDFDALFVKIGRRDGFKCAACGSVEALQLDHIEPVALGGVTHPDNLQLLCKPCNLRKGERTIDYRGTQQSDEVQ